MRRLLGGRLVLAVGLAVFLSAKIVVILVQTAAMGMPRLGDDAFTHLWRATQIERVGLLGALRGDGEAAYRGAGDIATLCQADTQASPSSRALCARVADNTAVADVKAGASVLLNAAMQTGLPWKWSYALFEAVVATVFGLSAAYFLTRLVGPAAAGIGLACLAFMTLLPPQGLHQFVPSTLAMALALALWGLVIRRGDSPYLYAAAAAGTGALSLVHPVALVYGGGLVVLAIYAFRRELTPLRLAIAAAVAAVVLMALLSFPNPVRSVLGEAMLADLWRVASINLAALPQRLSMFAALNAGIVAAILIGTLLSYRVIDGCVLAVIAALFLLLVAALFYRTEFFTFSMPLDLFARVFVGVAVVGCGLIGAILVNLWRDGSVLRRVAVAAAIPLLALPSVWSSQASFYGNVNGRGEVVDERALKTALTAFAPDATLAYGELEISPTAVFIAGGADRGAVPMKGLSPEMLRRTLDERRPAALVLPNYHVLNTLAVAKSHSLARRRYGFPAELIDMVAIGTSDAPIATLYIRVENNDDGPATIGPIRYTTVDGQQQSLSNLTVPARSNSWLRLDVGQFLPARRITLNLPPSGLWISGFEVNDPPRDGVRWPWDARAVVSWQRRDLPHDNRNLPALTFSLPKLFAYWNAQGSGLVPLPALRAVASDDSGLVFVTTTYPVRTSQD